MTKKDQNTEEKIVQAAEKIFIEKGMAGARMQEIADEAGINKALLHYYYRSKEKLFEIVFKMAAKTFLPNVVKVFKSDDDFFTKIRLFVLHYMNLIEKNPHIPGFIIHELNRRPESLVSNILEIGIDVRFILDQIEMEMEEGRIRKMEPQQLILNVISLCVFPIVARPVAVAILFKGDQKAYAKVLEERKTHVADFIINSIKL